MLNDTKFFSIVIPIYNTGKFLDFSVRSLFQQSLGFQDNVEIILINDGSSDDSEEICQQLVKKYPDNITYAHQDNGGVSSARNLGVSLAQGEWVGFLDPDDAYSFNTLAEVKKSIETFPNVDLFSMPMFSFGRERKSHRLNFKFGRINRNKIIKQAKSVNYDDDSETETKIIDVHEEPESIQLSSASTFIRKSLLKKNPFPNELSVGEDMVFLNRLFSRISQYGVLPNVIYYYRKRYDRSSIMDNIEESEQRYVPYTKKAMLEEIPSLLKDGKLSKYHQNVFLYEISGKIKSVERPTPLQNDEQFNAYLNVVWQVLQYIDDCTIKETRFLGSHRKYVLLDYKRHHKLRKFEDIFADSLTRTDKNILVKDEDGNVVKKLSNVTFNIDVFGQNKNGIQIMGFFETFFDFNNFKVYFENNKKEQIPVKLVPGVRDDCYFIGTLVAKTSKVKAHIPNEFLDKKLYLIVKDPQSGLARKVHLNFQGRKARIIKNVPGSSIELGEKMIYYENQQKSLLITKDPYQKEYLRLLENLSLEDYKNGQQAWSFSAIRNLIPYLKEKYKGKIVNIFMDREFKADDNGEALIKYFNSRKKKNELNYFVIDEESSDFERLKKDGVNVVPYGTLEHLKLLIVADNLITAHIAWAVVEPFYKMYRDKLKDLFSFNLIFLQHGITLSNVSHILKKSRIGVDMFVTSAYPENAELSRDAYEYDKDEVVLTGFPRHDNLTKKKGKYIAVMPTWSREVVSTETKNDLKQAIPGFTNTYYYNKWNSLLNNEKLLTEAKKRGYEIIFVPHPDIRGSVDMFDLDKVKLADFYTRYRDVINSSSCVITDRSSVFMDFAYVEKPVFYYGPYDNNNYDDGYFSFENDGFGPISTDEDTLISQLLTSMENNFEMDKMALERRNRFFAFNDSNNCERVYNEIKKLTFSPEVEMESQNKKKNFLDKIISK